MKKSFPLEKVYQLLEPGPVVMVSTLWKGKPNIMSMSWHMMMEFEPPLVGCVLGGQSYTFEILKETKECVINIPTIELASTVVDVGNTSGRLVDKFKKFRLAREPANVVKAPLVSACYANLECKVVDLKMVAKYNMFVLEVVQAWITTSRKRARTLHHNGYGVFTIDGKQIKLPSKMK